VNVLAKNERNEINVMANGSDENFNEDFKIDERK